MGARHAECRSCGKTVLFARHESTGKFAPLERDPDGRWTVVGESYFLASPNLGPDSRYTSHFSSCSGAASHRKSTTSGSTA